VHGKKERHRVYLGGDRLVEFQGFIVVTLGCKVDKRDDHRMLQAAYYVVKTGGRATWSPVQVLLFGNLRAV
jgi:hypothetical protein